MRRFLIALLATAALSGPALAEDRNPDLLDRLGRAIQNNDRAPSDRDRTDRDRDDRDRYGSSGYDRNRDNGRGDSAYDSRRRRTDEDRRDLDRRERYSDEPRRNYR